MDDVVVIFDATWWRDRFLLDTVGEIVGKVAAVFKTVVSTSSYAVAIKTEFQKKQRIVFNVFILLDKVYKIKC